MKWSFKRITSSGSFIPEIDGLRFIAIASVILFHISGFLIEKDQHTYNENIDYSFFTKLLSHGHLGVPLFFIISGFILALPFAKFHIAKANPVKLKNYFLRRLTRLEPPYILVMTILLFGSIYVAKSISWNDGVISYISSLVYSHGFIYDKGVQPLLNAPAWSLEIEVQFYILAPVIAFLLSIKSSGIRRLLLALIALLFLIFNHFNPLPFISIINYMHYFLMGFLLADLMISKETIFAKTKFDFLFGLAFFIIIWIFETNDFQLVYQKIIWDIVQLVSIFLLYYYVLFHKIFKFLSLRVITNIGGMCYSIYLLHYPIISMFGNPLLNFSFSNIEFINIFIYSILLLTAIMVISAVFFLLVERPCMDKDWISKLFKQFKRKDASMATEPLTAVVSKP